MRRAPGVATLHLWRVSRGHHRSALVAMARDRRALHHLCGLRFAKLLGVGRGGTFGVADVDLSRWALLATWARRADADAFELSTIVRRWQDRSDEQLRVVMRPLHSRGRWSGAQPFGAQQFGAQPFGAQPFGAQPPGRWGGPVAVVTRARLAPSKAMQFWRAAPAVGRTVRQQDGVLLAIGVGEAPIGWQGTFSLWRDERAMRRFAYDGVEHTAVAHRTPLVGWYAEELFARLAVEQVDGTYDGRRVEA